MGRAPSNTVGAHDAKTNLSQLLDRVEQGEAIVIVRHGEPVARLVPFAEPIDKEKVARAIKGIVALRKNRKRTIGDRTSIEDLINEGRTL